MVNQIVHHEDWQGSPLWEFIAAAFHSAGLRKDPPAFNQAQNQVFATINEGRWIAECPTHDGGAIVVSQTQPYFLCPTCGSPENAGNWYHIIFPSDKRVIENLLLKRPAKDNFQAINRNWKPGETIADLQRENNEHGIS